MDALVSYNLPIQDKAKTGNNTINHMHATTKNQVLDLLENYVM